NFHKVGFTPQIIEQLLSERGFKKFVWAYNNYHMFVRAWREEPKAETMLVATQEKDGKMIDKLIEVVEPKHEELPARVDEQQLDTEVSWIKTPQVVEVGGEIVREPVVEGEIKR